MAGSITLKIKEEKLTSSGHNFVDVFFGAHKGSQLCSWHLFDEGALLIPKGIKDERSLLASFLC